MKLIDKHDKGRPGPRTICALTLFATWATCAWIVHDIQSQAVAHGYARWCTSIPDSWAWAGECPEDQPKLRKDAP